MISPEEHQKLRELRTVLHSGLLPKEKFEDDYYLIRWLRARNMDVRKAAEMLEKSIQWRKENRADEMEEDEKAAKYRKIYPTGVLGRDKDDCLVLLLPFGRFNQRIIIDNEGMENAIRRNILWAERVMAMLKKCEEETGKRGLQVVKVVDFEFYSYKSLVDGDTRDFITKTNALLDSNYPEMLKYCMIINTPAIFNLLWNMIKPFLSKATLAKVQIFGAGGQEEEKWQEVLRQMVGPENIPERWGGTRKGSDRFCTNDKEIWIDGPLPLEYFEKGIVNFDGLKSEKIKAGEKFMVDFPINASTGHQQRKLCWRSKVDSHDIGFSIVFESKDGHQAVIYPEIKLDAKQGILEGFHEISGDSCGAYKLIFDNGYSYTRPKTVSYSVNLEN